MSRSTIRTFRLPLGFMLRADGTVWREDDGMLRQIALPRDSSGYAILHLRAPLARWICEAFHGAPKPGQLARHFDGDKTNDAASNVRWGTALDNAQDRDRHGRTARGVKHGRTKLTHAQIGEIMALKDSALQRDVAAKYGISINYVSKLWRGERKRITYAELTR